MRRSLADSEEEGKADSELEADRGDEGDASEDRSLQRVERVDALEPPSPSEGLDRK